MDTLELHTLYTIAQPNFYLASVVILSYGYEFLSVFIIYITVSFENYVFK